MNGALAPAGNGSMAAVSTKAEERANAADAELTASKEEGQEGRCQIEPPIPQKIQSKDLCLEVSTPLLVE